jgi:hypothetical protein
MDPGETFGDFPEMGSDLLVVSRPGCLHDLWVAADLEPTVGPDKRASGNVGSGRRVERGEGTLVGALGECPIGDRHHPSWLQEFATRNPITLTANAARSLILGGDVSPLPAVLWIVGILVVFVPLAVMRYRRAT